MKNSLKINIFLLTWRHGDCTLELGITRFCDGLDGLIRDTVFISLLLNRLTRLRFPDSIISNLPTRLTDHDLIIRTSRIGYTVIILPVDTVTPTVTDNSSATVRPLDG